MAAITGPRMDKRRPFRSVALPLAYGAGMKAWRNGMACIDTSAATVKPGASGNVNLQRVGTFADSYDNSAGSAVVNVMVDLDKEIVGQWFDNVTGANAVTSANLFQDSYIVDNNTVGNSGASSGNSKGGRIWALNGNSTKVLVEAYTL